MEIIVVILFCLFVWALIKPDADIFNKIPWLRSKRNRTRRICFTCLWYILTMICYTIGSSSEESEKPTIEKGQKEFVITDDSTAVILKGQDTLRFDGKGNIEWTAVGMNDGSSARVNILLTEEVGIYPLSVKLDKTNYDGFVYGGYKFYNGEYGIVGLYDFKDDNRLVRVGKASDHDTVIKKEDYKYLQSAIELDCKTQIKPLSLYDIKDFVSAVKVYIQNVDDETTQSAKREYTISNGDEAFKIILNGIFPDDRH